MKLIPVVMNNKGIYFLFVGCKSGRNKSGRKRNAWTKPLEIAVKKLNSTGNRIAIANTLIDQKKWFLRNKILAKMTYGKTPKKVVAIGNALKTGTLANNKGTEISDSSI